MVNTVIKETVDIYALPAIQQGYPVTAEVEITLGDLHANAVKLLFTLFKHGIASNITAEEYTQFVAIYQKPPDTLTKEDIIQFNHLLDKMEINSPAVIRLLGDELADRGQNDYFILKILQKLKDAKVPLEILLSNHSYEFIECYEKKKAFLTPRILGLKNLEQYQSATNLQILIDKKIIDPKEVTSVIEEAYMPHLKALSYTTNPNNNEITIFSHAAMELPHIKNLANQLSVAYKDKYVAELAETIDAINAAFQNKLKAQEAHTVIGDKFDDFPFYHLIWNRNCCSSPPIYRGYNLQFIHGHSIKNYSAYHIHSLDSPLGRLLTKNKGRYIVLFSDKRAILEHTNRFNLFSRKKLLQNPEPISFFAPTFSTYYAELSEKYLSPEEAVLFQQYLEEIQIFLASDNLMALPKKLTDTQNEIKSLYYKPLINEDFQKKFLLLASVTITILCISAAALTLTLAIPLLPISTFSLVGLISFGIITTCTMGLLGWSLGKRDEDNQLSKTFLHFFNSSMNECNQHLDSWRTIWKQEASELDIQEDNHFLTFPEERLRKSC